MFTLLEAIPYPEYIKSPGTRQVPRLLMNQSMAIYFTTTLRPAKM